MNLSIRSSTRLNRSTVRWLGLLDGIDVDGADVVPVERADLFLGSHTQPSPLQMGLVLGARHLETPSALPARPEGGFLQLDEPLLPLRPGDPDDVLVPLPKGGVPGLLVLRVVFGQELVTDNEDPTVLQVVPDVA